MHMKSLCRRASSHEHIVHCPTIIEFEFALSSFKYCAEKWKMKSERGRCQTICWRPPHTTLPEYQGFHRPSILYSPCPIIMQIFALRRLFNKQQHNIETDQQRSFHRMVVILRSTANSPESITHYPSAFFTIATSFDVPPIEGSGSFAPVLDVPPPRPSGLARPLYPDSRLYRQDALRFDYLETNHPSIRFIQANNAADVARLRSPARRTGSTIAKSPKHVRHRTLVSDVSRMNVKLCKDYEKISFLRLEVEQSQRALQQARSSCMSLRVKSQLLTASGSHEAALYQGALSTSCRRLEFARQRSEAFKIDLEMAEQNYRECYLDQHKALASGLGGHSELSLGSKTMTTSPIKCNRGCKY